MDPATEVGIRWRVDRESDGAPLHRRGTEADQAHGCDRESDSQDDEPENPASAARGRGQRDTRGRSGKVIAELCEVAGEVVGG